MVKKEIRKITEAEIEKVRKFREDRISKVSNNNEVPIEFSSNAKVVLHLIPIISFNLDQNYYINKISIDDNEKAKLMKQIYVAGSNIKYNYDGFLTYNSKSYVQFFRNGIIEALDEQLLDGRFIPSSAYEKALIEALDSYLSMFKKLQIELPVFVFLTFTGVEGYLMALRNNIYSKNKIDRDILLLPEMIIESYDIEAENILKPCFDSVCNACGEPKSHNYDEKGKWIDK